MIGYFVRLEDHEPGLRIVGLYHFILLFYYSSISFLKSFLVALLRLLVAAFALGVEVRRGSVDV